MTYRETQFPVDAAAKRLVITDAALDAIAGDLYLCDIGELPLGRMVNSIKETLDRMNAELSEHNVPSVYAMGIRPEVLDV